MLEAALLFSVVVAVGAAGAWMKLRREAVPRRRRAAQERLRGLARRLEGGAFDPASAVAEAATGALGTAMGRLEGREVRVALFHRPGPPVQLLASFQLSVPGESARLEVARPDLLARLGRLLGREAEGQVSPRLRVEVRRDGPGGRRLVQAAGAAAALEALLIQEGLARGRSGGALPDGRFDVRRAQQILQRLQQLAALCQLAPITVRSGARFGWTAGGAGVRCPFCREDLDPADPGAAGCETCGTAHHGACLEEAGGCTILGCEGGVVPLPRPAIKQRPVEG